MQTGSSQQTWMAKEVDFFGIAAADRSLKATSDTLLRETVHLNQLITSFDHGEDKPRDRSRECAAAPQRHALKAADKAPPLETAPRRDGAATRPADESASDTWEDF